jgi:arginine-tRNA-protein transferase
LRVPVERFRPGKSQRRCWRRNQDLSVAVDLAKCSDEKWALYARYESQRHGEPPGKNSVEDREAFEHFLYRSPVDTIECTYRDRSGRLLAVGICDICGQSLSSVYFFFDPGCARRGLGIFGVMWELDFARRQNIAQYYLGFWINGCRKMQYKADFRPYQILCADGQWRDGAEKS